MKCEYSAVSAVLLLQGSFRKEKILRTSYFAYKDLNIWRTELNIGKKRKLDSQLFIIKLFKYIEMNDIYMQITKIFLKFIINAL